MATITRNIVDKVKSALIKWVWEVDNKKLGSHAAIILFSTVFFVHITYSAFESKATDFYSFYTGADLLINNRQNLYNPEVQYTRQRQLFNEKLKNEMGFMAYVTPPLGAVLHIPFLLFQPSYAEIAAHSISLIIILFAIYRLYRFHRIKFLSWTTVFVSSFYPIYASVHLAQIGALIFWVMVEMYIAFAQKKSVKLGLLSSLLILKYQYLPFIILIYAIYEDKRKFILSSFVGLFILTFLNSLLITKDHIIQYIFSLKDYVAVPNSFGMAYKYGLDIYSVISELSGGLNSPFQSLFIIFTIALITQFIIAFLLIKRKDKYYHGSYIYYFCLLICLILTPHTMPADFIILIIPMMGLLTKSRKPWFYVFTVLTFNLYFYFSVFGWQWTHTLLLILYLPILAIISTKKIRGWWRILKRGVREEKILVGDPGIEPGTARV